MNLQPIISIKWNVDLYDLTEDQKAELRQAGLDRAAEQVAEGNREGELLHILSGSGEDADTLSGWWSIHQADNPIEAMAYHIQQLTTLVDEHIVNDGDTCETSQHMCLLNAINHLEQTLNGTERQDLKGEF